MVVVWITANWRWVTWIVQPWKTNIGNPPLLEFNSEFLKAQTLWPTLDTPNIIFLLWPTGAVLLAWLQKCYYNLHWPPPKCWNSTPFNRFLPQFMLARMQHSKPSHFNSPDASLASLDLVFSGDPTNYSLLLRLASASPPFPWNLPLRRLRGTQLPSLSCPGVLLHTNCHQLEPFTHKSTPPPAPFIALLRHCQKLPSPTPEGYHRSPEATGSNENPTSWSSFLNSTLPSLNQ
jgi:hypothetical protein